MKKSQIYLSRLKINLWTKQQNESFIIISFLLWSFHSTFLVNRFKIIPCKIICHPLNNKHKLKIKLNNNNLHSLKLKFFKFFCISQIINDLFIKHVIKVQPMMPWNVQSTVEKKNESKVTMKAHVQNKFSLVIDPIIFIR